MVKSTRCSDWTNTLVSADLCVVLSSHNRVKQKFNVPDRNPPIKIECYKDVICCFLLSQTKGPSASDNEPTDEISTVENHNLIGCAR